MTAYRLSDELARLTGDQQPRFLKTMNADSAFMTGIIRIAAGSTDHAWERHDGGDELLIILSGQAVFNLKDRDDKHLTRQSVAAGDVIYMPRGIAHNALISEDLEILFITPSQGNQDWQDVD